MKVKDDVAWTRAMIVGRKKSGQIWDTFGALAGERCEVGGGEE